MDVSELPKDANEIRLRNLIRPENILKGEDWEEKQLWECELNDKDPEEGDWNVRCTALGNTAKEAFENVKRKWQEAQSEENQKLGNPKFREALKEAHKHARVTEQDLEPISHSDEL